MKQEDKIKIINEIIKQLDGERPIVHDKSIMIRLTPQEIFNMTKAGATYWQNALRNKTSATVDEVCQFQVDLMIGVLRHSDPDRFQDNN
jgi:hypothetical protein